jgi:hypothetical protein
VHDVGGSVAPRRRGPAGRWCSTEPIIQFEDKKIHIRLEDGAAHRDRRGELTAAVPAELDQVYALVKERGVNSASLAERR